MADLATPSIPVSWGELLDKLTILEIKRERIARADARAHVAHEYAALRAIGAAALRDPKIASMVERLKAVNEELWGIEDAIREEEAVGTFGPAFVALARAVYRKNDERAAIKREINLRLRSELVEEKSYGGSGV